MEHGLVAGIHPADSGERLPGAGGDQLLARVATAGPCPITLVEDTSADREWAPLHVPHGTARFLMLTVGVRVRVDGRRRCARRSDPQLV